MLTRTFIEKTLLDIGGLAVDEDSSVAGAWQLYAYKMPRLTASLFTEKSSADSYKSVNLEFHNSTIQQRLDQHLNKSVFLMEMVFTSHPTPNLKRFALMSAS